jgi:predicted nucleic acid-binding protein
VKALVDTNVLLDVLLKREPFYMDSARVWSWADSGKIEGFVTAVSVTNLYYIVRKRASHAAAMEMMRAVLGAFTMVACDEALVERAMGAGLKDFEDAVQYQTALAAGVDVLVTRNVEHYPEEGLAVLGPSGFLAMEGMV